MIKHKAGNRIYHELKDELDGYIADIHLQNQYVDGKYCTQAEQKLEQITGRKHAVLVSSGTIALQIALLALDLRNKKIACPNYSYVASVNQAALLNDVDLFDVDQNGLLPCDQEYHYDAVIPVSLYGNSIDHHNLKTSGKIILDSAQSLGSKYKGQSDCAFGDISIVSFAENKPIPTFGTHGALLFDDDTLKDKILAIRSNGKLHRDTPIQDYGVNAVANEMFAAQIYCGLKKIETWQQRRKQIHNYYKDAFCNLPIRIIEASNYCESNYHKFILLSDQREQMYKHCHINNVEVLLHYTDNFANFFPSDGGFPMTDKLCKQILTLPNHAWLTDSEIEYIASTIKGYFK